MMPRASKRARLLTDILASHLAYSRSSEDAESDSDTDMEDNCRFLSQDYLTVLCHRYTVPQVLVPKSSSWLSLVLPAMDDERFIRQLRVSRRSFSILLNEINQDPIFANCHTPVPLQLALTLYRFGINGSGAKIVNVAQTFGLSDGSQITRNTDRVVLAIRRRCRKYIFWPSATDRKLIAQRLTTLPDCVGFLDGTHVSLPRAPANIMMPRGYFSRKQRYGLHLQIVVDDRKCIRHMVTGPTANKHDSTVFKSSKLWTDPDKYFAPTEYIVGDGAYALEKHTITPYRNPMPNSERFKFNFHISSHRMRVENTFGSLKKRFSSLQELRIHVDSGHDHQRACDWIEAVCILYNILLMNDDEWEDRGDETEEDNHYEGQESEDGKSRRELLKNFILSQIP